MQTLEVTTKKTEIVSIELIPAIAEDLKETSHFVDMGPGVPKRRVEKIRIGFPFWLKSQVTNKIEPRPYQLHESTDVYEIEEWLKNKMIYIAKDPFKK